MTEPQQPLIIVKCWTPSFKALKDGSKRFEYRKDDRPYAVGVTVKQEEWNPDTEYTGDVLYHDITWIIRGGVFGIPEGYCIFSTTEPRDTRSRPAPTPDVDCSTCKFGEQCRPLAYIPPCYNHGPDSPERAAAQAREKHDAKVREDVLDELEGLVNDKWEFMFGILPYNTEVSKKSIYKMINSLRTGGERR